MSQVQYVVPIAVSLASLLGAFIFLTYRKVRRDRKLKDLPVHRVLCAIQITDKKVYEAIEKNYLTVNTEDPEGCVALDLAVKRAMNEKIILALAKYCLPFDPDTLLPVPSKVCH